MPPVHLPDVLESICEEIVRLQQDYPPPRWDVANLTLEENKKLFSEIQTFLERLQNVAWPEYSEDGHLDPDSCDKINRICYFVDTYFGRAWAYSLLLQLTSPDFLFCQDEEEQAQYFAYFTYLDAFVEPCFHVGSKLQTYFTSSIYCAMEQVFNAFFVACALELFLTSNPRYAHQDHFRAFIDKAKGRLSAFPHHYLPTLFNRFMILLEKLSLSGSKKLYINIILPLLQSLDPYLVDNKWLFDRSVTSVSAPNGAPSDIIITVFVSTALRAFQERSKPAHWGEAVLDRMLDLKIVEHLPFLLFDLCRLYRESGRPELLEKVRRKIETFPAVTDERVLVDAFGTLIIRHSEVHMPDYLDHLPEEMVWFLRRSIVPLPGENRWTIHLEQLDCLQGKMILQGPGLTLENYEKWFRVLSGWLDALHPVVSELSEKINAEIVTRLQYFIKVLDCLIETQEEKIQLLREHQGKKIQEEVGVMRKLLTYQRSFLSMERALLSACIVGSDPLSSSPLLEKMNQLVASLDALEKTAANRRNKGGRHGRPKPKSGKQTGHFPNHFSSDTASMSGYTTMASTYKQQLNTKYERDHQGDITEDFNRWTKDFSRDDEFDVSFQNWKERAARSDDDGKMLFKVNLHALGFYRKRLLNSKYSTVRNRYFAAPDASPGVIRGDVDKFLKDGKRALINTIEFIKKTRHLLEEMVGTAQRENAELIRENTAFVVMSLSVEDLIEGVEGQRALFRKDARALQEFLAQKSAEKRSANPQALFTPPKKSNLAELILDDEYFIQTTEIDLVAEFKEFIADCKQCLDMESKAASSSSGSCSLSTELVLLDESECPSDDLSDRSPSP